MKNLEQIERIDLSNRYTIFRTKYDGPYTKEKFLNRIQQNESLFFYEKERKIDSQTMYIDCNEFKSIDESIINSGAFNLPTPYKIAKTSWVYNQDKEFTTSWMHTHEHLTSSNKTNLKTQWTYVFYIQIPTDMKQGEGDIVFKTEDDRLHHFTPKENDILIFPGDIPHLATPTPSSETKRIVYATNLTFDFDDMVSNNKRIQHMETIHKKYNKNGN
jgi:hypothetical protein